MKDILSRQDIQTLVDTFYQNALTNPIIGHFFTRVVQLDLKKHMPVMYDFWESILLESGTYKGNAMVKHIELNRKSVMTQEHFDEWLRLWRTNIADLFVGPVADMAVSRAEQIAGLMLFKVQQSANRNFIP